MIKGLKKLNSKKTVQEIDIPEKFLKGSKDLFAEYLHVFFNDANASSKFPSS